jgi:tetratricopeptide (TPR) repeat protein
VAFNRDKVLETAQKLVEKKKYDKAVEELRKLVQHDQNDARTLLKIGDLEVKQSKYTDAINTYERVGKLYAQQGFALKAIAVYKQIREIIAKHVPNEEEKYGHITPRLAELYQQLGLTSDAPAAAAARPGGDRRLPEDRRARPDQPDHAPSPGRGALAHPRRRGRRRGVQDRGLPARGDRAARRRHQGPRAPAAPPARRRAGAHLRRAVSRAWPTAGRHAGAGEAPALLPGRSA